VVSLKSILSASWAYRLFGAAIGAHFARDRFASLYVRPSAGQRVLDIGCGTGDLVPYLPGTVYVGFDASPIYIAAARSLHGDRGRFICQRVRDHVVENLAGFDVAIASGVLHHLDDAEALQLFRIAHASLKPGGRLVTYDGCYTDTQGAAARFLLSHDRGEHVRTEDAYRRLASQIFEHVQASLRDDLLRIPYTHIILECMRSPAYRSDSGRRQIRTGTSV
jgi:SAM-dependent methyltransferase